MTLTIDVQAKLGALALDVQITAPSGVTVIFGASGAGKTSIINAVAGLLQPDAGRIALNGTVLFGDKANVPPSKRNVGYVFQDARLFPHLNVRKNLTYGGTYDYDRIVDVLGLSDLLDRKPAGLSGGEAQRVALGRALMRDPKVLLMDEPLAALDGPRKAEVMPYLAELARSAGLPILYVTHAMEEVTQLADQLVVLDQGQVAHAGSVTDVLADPQVARFFAKRDAGALATCIVQEHDRDAGVTVLASGAGAIYLPGAVGTVGQGLRLRIPAQDVILSRMPPQEQSALNALETEVTAVMELQNGNFAIGLQAKALPLWAEVTPLSVQRLGLIKGLMVFAIFKATAVGPV